MSCLLILKIPSLYCNPQFVMKQLGLGGVDNCVQHIAEVPTSFFLHVAVGKAVDSIVPSAQ